MEGSAIASVLFLSLVIVSSHHTNSSSSSSSRSLMCNRSSSTYAQALVLRWFCKPVLQSRGGRNRLQLDSTYADPDTGDLHRFPNVFESEAQLSLSLVIPVSVVPASSLHSFTVAQAYNEKERMPTMLNEALKYLQERKSMQRGFSYEIIIVDDGSTDRTYVRSHERCCVRVCVCVL